MDVRPVVSLDGGDVSMCRVEVEKVDNEIGRRVGGGGSECAVEGGRGGTGAEEGGGGEAGEVGEGELLRGGRRGGWR